MAKKLKYYVDFAGKDPGQARIQCFTAFKLAHGPAIISSAEAKPDRLEVTVLGIPSVQQQSCFSSGPYSALTT